MKLIIAGTRGTPKRLYTCIGFIVAQLGWEPLEIVSGACPNSPDIWGEEFAIEKGLTLTRFPADWSKGLSAGMQRNRTMADYADAALIFWDGISKGSKHMKELMENSKKFCVTLQWRDEAEDRPDFVGPKLPRY